MTEALTDRRPRLGAAALTRAMGSPPVRILQRVLFFALALLGATVVVFAITYMVPGDIAAQLLGDTATPERIAELNQQLGLDQPIWVQYWNYLSGLLRGDLGTSIMTDESVAAIVARTLPRTLQLVVATILIAIAIGVPMGIIAARRKGRLPDTVAQVYSTVAISMPTFWVGIILVSVFALSLGWFPASGLPPLTSEPIRSLWATVLPALALASTTSALIARQTRNSMLSVLGSEFIRTQTAMGYSQRSIVWRHALKNAAIPVVTILGITINHAVGFTVIIESVFAIPGLGTAMVTGAVARDLPVVQGGLIVIVAIVMITNLLLDLLYMWIDPRIGGSK